MRPAVLPDDEAFLKALYTSTREEDAAMWGLPEEQASALVDMQYRAQKMQYDAQYPDAKHEIILLDEVPVGRAMATRNETEVHAIDLAIRPEYRSRGIGSMILKNWAREAEETSRAFTFSVAKSNFKAISLYQRLGFVFTGETVSHYYVEGKPRQA